MIFYALVWGGGYGGVEGVDEDFWFEGILLVALVDMIMITPCY